jgi:single-stranded-DNA-specific exonuclease
MVNRGIRTVEEARLFLAPTLRHSLPNPVGIKNIELAADLILTAVEDKQQIVLFTDFDVDGLTAGAQLYLFLSALGARVMHYTPNRFTEGYGLSRGPVEKFIQAKIDLLVTIDCGISNVQEIDLAKRHGVSTVIIDHHIPHDLPPADAIVNPAQEGCPFQEHKLCAATGCLRIAASKRCKQALAPG